MIVGAAWTALLAFTVAVYYPGFSGPFLLDDYGTLAGLGDHGGVVNWETFKAFVFGGHSGPTGRPVSLLTFLLDGNNWPTDPAPFKRTNLVIHLLNGLALGWLIAGILKVLDYDRRSALAITFVATAFWLLHPFLVSTTLYVVQRMAQLSTLFIFLGLAAYVRARVDLIRNPKQAYIGMTLAMGAFTLLSMLSKENGILLPLLVGVLEVTVFAASRERFGSPDRRWSAVCLGVPVLVIGAYLSYQFFRPDFFNVVAPRDFSIYERFLTQFRVLIDYLQNWFIPKLYTTGVFQDHIIKSTSPIAPWTTLASFLLHVAAITFAIRKRKVLPLVALAVLFFYVGHLLESTVLNLELYFEHRNYLPAALLILPVVAALYGKARPPVFVAVSALFIVVIGGFTNYTATIWQEFSKIVEASAFKAPTSARAQAQFATNLYNLGRHEDALQVIDRAIATIPSYKPHLEVNRLIILCNQNQLPEQEFRRVMGDLARTNYDPRLIQVYMALVTAIVEQRCPSIQVADLRPAFAGMLDIPKNADPASLEYSQIQYFIGLTYAYSNQPDAALLAYKKSLESRPGASHAMAMASQLASNNHFDEALELSEIAVSQIDADRASTMRGSRVSVDDIRGFQEAVRLDREQAQALDN